MARAADWFYKLSKKAQAEYIKAHPNSKYAKGGKTPAVKPTSVAARVLAMSKTYTNTANGLIKKAKEKMALAKTPATKAKWKAEVSRLTSIKQTLKVLGAKGKGISVELKAGTIHSVSPLGGTSSTRRKPTVSTTASKVKAHDAKRAADKNKVIAKTPSAKAKPATKLAMLQAKLKDAKARLAEQRKNKRVTRSLPTLVKQLEDKVKAEKAKTPKLRKTPNTMAGRIAQRKADKKRGLTSLIKAATATLASNKAAVKLAKTPAAKAKAQAKVASTAAKIAKMKKAIISL